jgi:hypothetical protein
LHATARIAPSRGIDITAPVRATKIAESEAIPPSPSLPDTAPLSGTSILQTTAPIAPSPRIARSATIFTDPMAATASFLASPTFAFTSPFNNSFLFIESLPSFETLFFAQSAAFAPSPSYGVSVIFAASALFSASRVFTQSLLFSASAPFSQSAVFEPSGSFRASLSFSPSAPFPTFPASTVPVTATPLPTVTPIGAGVSILYEDSVTISQTVSLSDLVISLTFLSDTNTITYSLWQLIESDASGNERVTQTVVSFATVAEIIMISMSRIQVELPVYVSRVIQISRIIRITSLQVEAGDSMNAATLIGSVSGVALVISLIIAGVLFVVRSKGGAETPNTDSDSQIEELASNVSIPALDGISDMDDENIELAQSIAQFGDGQSDDIPCGGDTDDSDLAVYL